MAGIVVSTNKADTTTGLGTADTGQAEIQGAGVFGRSGGKGYAVTTVPAPVSNSTPQANAIWANNSTSNDQWVQFVVDALPTWGASLGLINGCSTTDGNTGYLMLVSASGKVSQWKRQNAYDWGTNGSWTPPETASGTVNPGDTVRFRCQYVSPTELIMTTSVNGVVVQTITETQPNTLGGFSGVRVGGNAANVARFSAFAMNDQNVAPPSGAVPAAPTGQAATAGGENQITVTWDAVTGSDPALTGYVVEADGAESGTPNTTWTHTSLAAGTTHSYRVKALNSLGASPWSGWASTTTASAPAGAPTTYVEATLNAAGLLRTSTGWADLGNGRMALLSIPTGGGGTEEPTDPPVDPPPQPTGAFTTSGSQILDPQGNVFIPRGFNIGGIGAAASYSSQVLSDTVVKYWKAQGVNTLRITQNATAMKSYGWAVTGTWNGKTGHDGMVAYLTDIVNLWSNANGLVTMVEFHDFTDGINEAGIVNAIAAWKKVAVAFKDNPRVWFNTCNEPAVNGAAWTSLQDRLLAAIRGTGAQNVCILDAPISGNDIGIHSSFNTPRSYQLAAGLKHYGNIVLAQHNYGYNDVYTSQSPYVAYVNAVHGAGFPLIHGEVGATYNQSGYYAQNLAGMQMCLTYGKPLGVGSLFWANLFGDDFTMRVNKTDFLPTTAGVAYSQAGQIFYNYLRSFPVTPATPVGPSTDLTNQTFTASNGLTSKYHVYAAGITQPAGLVLQFHGDAAYEFNNPTSSYSLGGTNGIIQNARTRGYITVPVLAPDTTGTVTWWENGATNADYVRDLLAKLKTVYGIREDKVWLVGYSGGAQFITQFYLPKHSGTITGGGAVIFGGGDSPAVTVQPFAAGFKAAFPMFWYTGADDDGSSSSDGYDALSDAVAGEAWYSGQGFTTGHTYPAGVAHNLSGRFGNVVGARLDA